MTFSLESMTKAKLLEVMVLSQKNRQPDENPGVKLVIVMDLGADALAYFDGSLRTFLLARNESAQQGALDGMASEVLTPAGSKIGSFKWRQQQTGMTLVIDHGTGGRSNLEIKDCTVDGFKLTPKEGGFSLKVNVECSDVSEKAFGCLAKLKSYPIELLLLPPEVQQDQLPGTKGDPAPTGGKKTATEEFIDRNTMGKTAAAAH